MLSRIILPTLLAAAISSVTSRATPIDNDIPQDLKTRDNKFNLHCSNAPGVVAGGNITQADVVLSTNLPESGSNQKWMKYLWCTPNTLTYTFFNLGDASAAPNQYYNVYEGLNQAAVNAHTHVSGWGDGGLVLGSYSLRPSNTNVYITVQDSVGKMTWGILGAALSGLANMVQNFDKANAPIVFQINDGEWGEVGVGIVGLLTGDGVGDANCCYEITSAGGCKQCIDLYNHKVQGLN